MENKREIYGKMLEIRNRIDAIKALDSNYLENAEYKEKSKIFESLEEKLKENINTSQTEEKLNIYEEKTKSNKWNKIKTKIKELLSKFNNMSNNNKNM